MSEHDLDNLSFIEKQDGWFKIYRGLFNKAIWKYSTPTQKIILIVLLGMANHEKSEWEWKGKQFKAGAGEFVTSLESIVKKCGKGISVQNVRTALRKFERYGFLTQESTKTGRLIRIVNWGLYQNNPLYINQENNKKVTNISQSTNNDLTTNKNDKNYKNDKNNIYISQFTDNEILRETILDFLYMRESIKKPMTHKALKLLLDQLKKLTYDEEKQIMILENSIEHCWTGIYPLKEDGFNYGTSLNNKDRNGKKFNIKIPEWNPNETEDYSGEDPF